MPIHLHHGPANLQKQNKLFELISQDSNSQADYIVLVPHKGFVHSHKHKILNNDPKSILLGQSVIPWDEFLLKLTKYNLPRVHLADSIFSYYLLFLLIKTKYTNFLYKQPDLLKIIKDIYNFFLQMKVSGLTESQANLILGDGHQDQKLFQLLQDYNHELHKRFYFDQGDLYVTILTLLKENKFKLPNPNLKIYLSQIYPLKPGQREILRHLNYRFPNLKITIFYDEEFSQQNELLEKAYQDLGDMSADSQYYELSDTLSASIMFYQNPIEEIITTTKKIKQKIKDGVHPNQIAIILTDPNYSNDLIQFLHKFRIPYSLKMPQKASQFLNTTDYVSQPHGLTVSQSHSRPISQIPDMRQETNLFASLKLKAQASFEELHKNFLFIDNLLDDFTNQILPIDKQHFFNDLINDQTIEPNTFNEQVIITSLADALIYTDKMLFVMGCQLESLITTTENTLFSPQLYTKKDLHELINSPSYKFSINLERLKQLIGLGQDIEFSAAEVGLSEKPTTKLNLGNKFNLNYKLHQYTEYKQKATNDTQQNNEYFKTKKKSFSISALQEYLNCPYRYYAQYHLNLGTIENEDLEPGGDLKGSFVHHILYRLLKENESDYLEGLEYKSYRIRLTKKLASLIQEEIDKNEQLNNYNKNIIDFYAYRVFKTILEMINQEAQYFKDKKKKTLPKHYEWPFGIDHKNLYEIQTKYGPISLRGRIDRIDACHTDQCFSVIDYKTGQIPTNADLKSGKSLQLPLYLMVVKKLLYPNYNPSGAYFYALKENEIKGFTIQSTADSSLMHKRSQISEEEWNDIQNNINLKIHEAVDGIHHGNFDPNPNDIKLCEFCDYKRICGKNASGQWTADSEQQVSSSVHCPPSTVHSK